MEKIRKIIWETPEYTSKEKSSDWYFAFGIISILSSATSFLLNNTLFSILILIGAFALIIYGLKKPRVLNINLNDRGILVNSILYPYSNIESFWVEENTENPKILMKSKKVFVPYIIIPLGDTNPEIVRNFLFEHLKEEEHHEPLSQKLMEYLGF